MAYIVRIFDGDITKDICLDGKISFAIGNGMEDDYCINTQDNEAKRAVLVKCDDNWKIEKCKNVFFNGSMVSGNEIKPGDIYTLGMQNTVTLWLYEQNDNAVQSIEWHRLKNTLSLGRSIKCDIAFKDKKVSNTHALLYRYAEKLDEWHICDAASTNGTFVNGKRIQDTVIKPNDEIQFATYTLKVTETELLLYGNEDAVEIRDGLVKTTSKSNEAVIPYREYPDFSLSPRLKKTMPKGEIEIDAPPSAGAMPEINWLSVILPPIAMIVIMLAIVVVTDGSQLSLYYTVPMSVLSILISVTTYISQRKKHKQRETLRLQRYEEYLQNKISEIEDMRKKQMDALTLAHPSTKNCFQRVYNVERRLWERQVEDEDFLDVCLGYGDIDFSMAIKVPRISITLDDDVLKTKPEEIKKKYTTIENAPIVLKLTEIGSCGIIGNHKDVIKLVRNIVAQIASHHSYNDVKLVTIFSKDEYDQLDWIKWLPHSFDNNHEVRYMADDAYSVNSLFHKMEAILSQREKDSENSSKAPHYLFIISNKELVEDQAFMRFLTSNDSKLGISVLFLFEQLKELPKECNVIIEVDNGNGKVYPKAAVEQEAFFEIEKLNDYNFENFARKMFPIRLDVGIEEKLLPKCVTFLEGYGVKRPNEINLDANWNSSLTYKSMAVPIGVGVNGEDFYFDIHEKKYGPHGLVAGMTGSGKSEMIQSWILSMALKFSPEDVSFVLIDFKGTGLLLPFINMPHLAGTISDLDTNITRNLIALENELSRRKALLDEAGVNNINAYLKAYKDGKVKEPLSFLFIVIDEFAEFKVQFPDFMTVINRVFAIGRTLGVFAILLTQKPAGVVDDKMNANTRFRWCLKVANSADSKDMLKHPDAAKITVPGRAYVQVGEDEVYELIQSYWSGAPYNPDKKRTSSVKPTISVLGIGGERIEPVVQEKSVGLNSELNEIDAIVDYISTHAKEQNINSAKKIWEPKMPSYIPLPDLVGSVFDGVNWPQNDGTLQPIVGFVDNPHLQCQYPLNLNISGEGHIVIYGAPGTGKTTFMHTLIMSLCMMYNPEAVNLYVMDFGGWSLNIFKGYPHIGGIVNDNESDRINKLVRLIDKEIQNRKYRFADVGVGNIHGYRDATGEHVPYILLLVDNFAPVLNLYPDLEDFFIRLTREGGNYGIYMITNANNTMSLGFKLAQNIKMALTLQMTDRSDYAAIVGKTNGLEPEKYEGRGLIKGTPPLEFQTALPVGGKNESERIQKIKKIAEKMNDAWSGKRAKAIPMMPEVISFGSIQSNKIAIGLSTQDIEPIEIDFDLIHYIAISGKSRSGKSNMLQNIAKQKHPYKMIVFDSLDEALLDLKQTCDTYLETGSEFDEVIAGLIPVLQQRRESYLADNHSKFDEILIIIDDLKECFDNVSDETVRRLDAIIRLGKGLNVNLIVAGDCGDFKKLSSQGEFFTTGLVNSSVAILLGGSYSDHNCFKSNIPYSEANDNVGEFEGYCIEQEKAIRFKAMYCK